MILNSFINEKITDISHTSPHWLFKFIKGKLLIGCPWRILEGGKKFLASGDEGQIYGLTEPIDLKKQVMLLLSGKKITKFEIEEKTGDISIEFEQDIILQTYGFDSYESWEITAPDGSYYVFNDRINEWAPQC